MDRFVGEGEEKKMGRGLQKAMIGSRKREGELWRDQKGKNFLLIFPPQSGQSWGKT